MQIHKHSTNVPLGMLFESFGINDICDLNESCKGQVVYLNGDRYHSDISKYEISHDDRILISFEEESISEHLKYLDSLNIFDVPKKANFGNEIFI